MKILQVMGCAILSGCLLGLALPPCQVPILGWIALVPLFLSIQSSRFLIGFCAGLVTALVPAWLFAQGIVSVPHPMLGDGSWIYGGYLLFGALLAAMGGIVADSKPFGLRKAAQFGALGVLFEFALLFLLPEHLALTMSNFKPALGIASVTGIWGVSFLVWFFNIAIAASFRSRSRLTRLVVLWAAVTLFGAAVFEFGSNPTLIGPKVAVIQTESIDPTHLADMNRKAFQRGATLSVWPELSGSGSAYAGNTRELRLLSAQAGLPAFVTSFEDGAVPKPHNAAALFDHGRESERYFKRKPFAGERNTHEAGNTPVAAKWHPAIGMNICFDSCYPSVIRDTANLGGIEFIALPTLDPISRGGVVQSLHAAYTPFRAAELGMSICRADVSAYSMIVGPDGVALATLGVGDGVAVASLPKPHVTIYRRFGDWFLIVCGLILGTPALKRLFARKLEPLIDPIN